MHNDETTTWLGARVDGRRARVPWGLQRAEDEGRVARRETASGIPYWVSREGGPCGATLWCGSAHPTGLGGQAPARPGLYKVRVGQRILYRGMRLEAALRALARRRGRRGR